MVFFLVWGLVVFIPFSLFVVPVPGTGVNRKWSSLSQNYLPLQPLQEGKPLASRSVNTSLPFFTSAATMAGLPSDDFGYEEPNVPLNICILCARFLILNFMLSIMLIY